MLYQDEVANRAKYNFHMVYGINYCSKKFNSTCGSLLRQTFVKTDIHWGRTLYTYLLMRVDLCFETYRFGKSHTLLGYKWLNLELWSHIHIQNGNCCAKRKAGAIPFTTTWQLVSWSFAAWKLVYLNFLQIKDKQVSSNYLA
jgi:hypothetical protein